MVDKRNRLLTRLEEMSEDHPNYQRYKARADVIKDLGVVSNGRLGFAMAIFGRINAFETLAWVVRKILMEAKNIASNLGCRVYHWYVDSLFIARDGCTTKADFQDVVNAIESETKCKIKVEEVYTWIAFVSSTEDPDLPVANKFFCRKPDGTLKIRGLHERRGDTCEFVREIQRAALGILAAEPDIYKLQKLLPAIVKTVLAQIDDLNKGKIPLGDLISTQVLSREWNEYTVAVPHSIAAAQLAAIGKPLRMGQAVRYIHTLGDPGVHAWDLPTKPNSKAIDIPHYEDLVLRAVYEVARPLGVPEQLLSDWLLRGATYVHPEDFADLRNKRFDAEMPLFTTLDAYEKKLISIV
jgi:DNA polymerase elongation subunit (family B)